MPLSEGKRLGPYEITSAIGAGGMGEVYKARDTRLNRTVAIKVLPADVASDPQYRERFDREARVVATLNHPHICTLHDVGRQDDVDYLVMEYLEGQTLADRLRRGVLPLARFFARAIRRPCLRFLAAASCACTATTRVTGTTWHRTVSVS
jgi:serine/threonine protein kinase